MFPDFFGIARFGKNTTKAPIVKAFGTTLRGTSEVVIPDSDIREFGPMENHKLIPKKNRSLQTSTNTTICVAPRLIHL